MSSCVGLVARATSGHIGLCAKGGGAALEDHISVGPTSALASQQFISAGNTMVYILQPSTSCALLECQQDECGHTNQLQNKDTEV